MNKPWQQALARFSPIGIALTAFLVLSCTPTWQTKFEPIGAILRLATFGPLCLFVILAATHDGPIKHWLSWRPLVLVGTFSYSLYLIHEPFIMLAAIMILPRHWPNIIQFSCQTVVLPALLIGLAYLFFLAFEKPFLRRPVKKAIEAEQLGRATASAATETA